MIKVKYFIFKVTTLWFTEDGLNIHVRLLKNDWNTEKNFIIQDILLDNFRLT